MTMGRGEASAGSIPARFLDRSATVGRRDGSMGADGRNLSRDVVLASTARGGATTPYFSGRTGRNGLARAASWWLHARRRQCQAAAARPSSLRSEH